VRRAWLSGLAVAVFGSLTLAAGAAALAATPRDRCAWQADDFCSDYGRFYRAFSGIFAVLLIASLWAILRRREG